MPENKETFWWETENNNSNIQTKDQTPVAIEDKPWWQSGPSQDIQSTQVGEVDNELKEEEELSSWQSVSNSLSNFGEQLGDVFEFYGGIFDVDAVKNEDGTQGANESFDIAAYALHSGIFGPSEVSSKEILSSLKGYETEKAQTKRTKGILESIEKGDIGGAFAGGLNAITNGLGSAIYGASTFGAGFLADYSAENYIEFNKLKAENLNKSFKDLVTEGEADVAVPLGIAAVQSGMEAFALSKIMKVVGGKGGMNPLSSFGKELATKALYNKSARTTLSILGTGSTEFITEIGQHAAEQVNKELGRVSGTDEEAKIKNTIIDAVTSQEGLEAGIQGFIGGGGMASMSYSARAVSEARKVVTPGDIESDIIKIAELEKEIKDTKDKDLIDGKKETLKQRKIALADKRRKGNEAYNKLTDDEILEIEERSELADVAAYKLTELNKKLESGQITEEEYKSASEGFNKTYQSAKAKINEVIYETDKAKAEEISKETGLNVKKSATEQEYADDIIKDQSADNESDPNNFNNEKELDDFIAKETTENESKKDQEKITAAINLKKEIEGAKATGGLFSGQGKIFINEKLSKAQGDVSVNTHEVLHPILNALVGNRAEQGKIVKQLKKAATWNQRRYVAQQLRTRKVAKENHDTEWINILSDGIIKGEVGYDKNTFEKMGDAFKSIFGAKQVSTVGFEDGQQVYNFIKEYTSTSPDGAASKIALKAIKDAEAKAKVKIKDIGGVGGSQASNLNEFFEAMHPERSKESVGEFMDTMLVDKQTGVKTDDISNTPFADQIGGMIGSIINRTYNNVKDPNSYTKADYKRDLLNEAILLVKNEYNPELQSLDKFLSSRLNLRANNLIDRLGERGDIKTESMTRQMAGADEGTPARQFASEAPNALESMIEVQEELESQDASIRKELEIEDGSSIYNEVIALVKEEISNIEGVIKQSDILNIKNKLVKTFGKALQKTLKNRIGGDKEHRAFVKKYSLVIYNKFTTKQLTALARELGNDNYFTYKPLGDKKLSYSQAKAAQNMDLIEVKNLKSGPVLKLKYNVSEDTDNETSITPETIAERFNEYFFPPAINPVTGERSSKKGTRKDAMARNIGAEMAFDAVMQVLTSPEVIQFRASKLSSEFLEDTDAKIQELEDSSIDNIVNVSKSQGKEITEQEVADQIAKEQLKAEIAIVSKAISRDPGFQFSNIASEDKKVLKDNAPNIIGFLEQMLDIFNGPITEENKSGIEKLNVNDDLKKALTSLYNELFESNTVVVDNTINTEKEALNSAYFSKILKNIDPELANFFETKKHLASFKDGKTRVVNQEVTDTLADGSKTLLESLPKEFHQLLSLVLPPSSMYQIFGQGYRALDAAKGKQFYDLFNFKNYTKDDSPSFNYEVEIEKAKTKTEIDYVEALNDLLNLQEAGVSPEPQIVSSKKATLLGTIRDKFKGKKSLTPEEQTRLEKVNEANRALLKVVTLALKKEYEKGKIGKDYLVPIFFSQSLMTRGFRALSQIQGFIFKTTNESGNIIDAVMNKGEHININGNSMAELYQYITENKNLKQKSLYDIITDHAQVFGDKKTFDKLDSKHGLVSTLGINRIINALTSSEIFNSFSLFKGDRKTFLRQAITSIDSELQFSKINKKQIGNGIGTSSIANKISNDSGSSIDFNKSNFSKLTNLPEYKKFVKNLKGKKLYRGGGQIQPGKKATWWYVDDKSDALFISERFTDDIAKREGYETIYGPIKQWTKEVMDKFDPYLNTLTSDIDQIGKNALIIPDINVENQGFKNWFKTNFPNQYKNVINAFHRIPFTDRVFNGVLDIKDILKQDNAEQILIGYIKHIAKNGQPTSYFDRLKQNKTINIYSKNQGMPVIVLGEIESSSLQFSNNKKTASTEEDVSPMSEGFNQIIEQTKGVKADETFSQTVAKQKGATVGRFKFFVPPSAEDFMGLIYSFLSKGKIGDAQRVFFEIYLNAPYKRGIAMMEAAKQKIEDDYRKHRKKFPEIAKKLGKKIPAFKDTKLSEITYDQAVRIFIWDYAGFDMESTGLDKSDIKKIAKFVQDDTNLVQFARGLGLITGLEKGYSEPTAFWLTENIASDLNNIVEKIGRKEYLTEFINNSKEIFSKENLNKIEATYGSNFREALEDMLFRMEKGSNRNFGKNRMVNQWSNWINNSVGAIMFFNMRSATLQIISSVNFLNWNDNNPIKAAAAFANQKQFWTDFVTLFNSDKLKQRRKGLKTDVNQAELANSVADSKNKAKAALKFLLKIGFAPTQIADSFAIAIGGASMYRNRVNTYKKQGMSVEQAEKAAFDDFSAIAEETQQSSDPSLVSQQQSGPLGRLILAFQNTPMQYARLMKKAALDLANKRGDWKTNVSKLIYYGAIQNIIFSSMQTALFAMAFDDDDDEDKNKLKKKKEFMVANGMVDSILRGAGIGGAAVATVKNAILEYYKQEEKEYGTDHSYTLLQLMNVSPPIGSKLRKVYSAIQTNRFEEDVIDARGFALDSPIYRVGGNLISAATNVPVDRLINKMNNATAAMDNQNETWQRIALALGWNTWDLGVENQEHELIKTNAKDARRKAGYEKATKKRSNDNKKSLLDISRSNSIKLNK